MSVDAQLTPLEHAVLTALHNDPSIPVDVRKEANDYCNAFKASPESWRYCCQQFLLRSRFPQELLVSQVQNGSGQAPRNVITSANQWLMEVRYWYLHVILEHCLNLSGNDRQTVREMIHVYASDVLLWRASSFSTYLQQYEAEPNIANKPAALVPSVDASAIITAIALLYVRSLLLDYPDGWPGAVQWLVTDLVKRCSDQWHSYRQDAQSPSATSYIVARQQYVAVVQFFCCIWEMFDEEIVQEPTDSNVLRRNMNMRVKDALRDGDILAVSTTIKCILQDFCSDFAQESSNGSNQHNVDASTVSHVLRRVLLVTASLASWIDIQILANPSFLNLIFRFFCRQSGCGTAAMDVLKALFDKRMHPGQRILMTHRLSLLDQILVRSSASEVYHEETTIKGQGPTSYVTNAECDPPDPYSVQIAKLVGFVGVQLVESLKELHKDYDSVAGVLTNGREEGRRPSDSDATASDTSADPRAVGGVKGAGVNPFYVPITSPEIWKEMQVEAWEMVKKLLPCIGSIYSYPHPQLTECVLPFLCCFLRLAKSLVQSEPNPSSLSFKVAKFPADDPRCPLCVPIDELRPFFAAVLKLTLDRVQYPFWFTFNASTMSESEELFLTFRNDVTSMVLKHLYSLDEKRSLMFLREATEHLTSAVREYGVARVHPHRCESVLFLLLKMADNYKDVGKALPNFDYLLAHCLCNLFSCREVIYCANPQVRILVFKLITAYLPFLFNRRLHPENEQYIDRVLHLLLSGDGILTSVAPNALPEEETVLGHATLTFLRFVRFDPPQIQPYTFQILTALEQAGLLRVTYLPYSEWQSEEAPGKNCTARESQAPSTTVSPAVEASGIVFPSGLPRAPWSFDDQYRCLESMGVLLGTSVVGAPATPTPQDAVSAALDRVIEPLLSPFLQQEGHTPYVELLLRDDYLGASDYITRVLTAMTSFTKRFTPALARMLSVNLRRYVKVLHLLVRYAGQMARVRAAAALFLRRIAFLLSTDLMPYLGCLLAELFDCCIVAFLRSSPDAAGHHVGGTPVSSQDAQPPPHNELLQSVATTSFFMPPASASSVPSREMMFSGYFEISQLLTLLNFLVTLYKGERGKPLWLTCISKNRLQRAGDPLADSGDERLLFTPSSSSNLATTASSDLLSLPFNRSCPAANTSSSTGPSESSSWDALPLVLRLMIQCICVWRIMPTDSVEMRRQRNEVQQDIYFSLVTLASDAPEVLFDLFKHYSAEDHIPPQFSILHWMISGCHPESASSMRVVASCLQAWSFLLKYMFSSALFGLPDAPAVADRDRVLFDHFRLADVVCGTTRLIFLLDLEDPRHQKVVLEFCGFLRTFATGCTSSANGVSCVAAGSNPGLEQPLQQLTSSAMARLQHLFLSSLPSHVCSPQDAVLVFHAVTLQATSTKSAKDTLTKWIITQQMAARHLPVDPHNNSPP